MGNTTPKSEKSVKSVNGDNITSVQSKTPSKPLLSSPIRALEDKSKNSRLSKSSQQLRHLPHPLNGFSSNDTDDSHSLNRVPKINTSGINNSSRSGSSSKRSFLYSPSDVKLNIHSPLNSPKKDEIMSGRSLARGHLTPLATPPKLSARRMSPTSLLLSDRSNHDGIRIPSFRSRDGLNTMASDHDVKGSAGSGLSLDLTQSPMRGYHFPTVEVDDSYSNVRSLNSPKYDTKLSSASPMKLAPINTKIQLQNHQQKVSSPRDQDLPPMVTTPRSKVYETDISHISPAGAGISGVGVVPLVLPPIHRFPVLEDNSLGKISSSSSSSKALYQPQQSSQSQSQFQSQSTRNISFQITPNSSQHGDSASLSTPLVEGELSDLCFVPPAVPTTPRLSDKLGLSLSLSGLGGSSSSKSLYNHSSSNRNSNNFSRMSISSSQKLNVLVPDDDNSIDGGEDNAASKEINDMEQYLSQNPNFGMVFDTGTSHNNNINTKYGRDNDSGFNDKKNHKRSSNDVPDVDELAAMILDSNRSPRPLQTHRQMRPLDTSALIDQSESQQTVIASVMSSPNRLSLLSNEQQQQLMATTTHVLDTENNNDIDDDVVEVSVEDFIEIRFVVVCLCVAVYLFLYLFRCVVYYTLLPYYIYVIFRHVGTGASSTVVEALHVPTFTLVALKKLPLYNPEK